MHYAYANILYGRVSQVTTAARLCLRIHPAGMGRIISVIQQPVA